MNRARRVSRAYVETVFPYRWAVARRQEQKAKQARLHALHKSLPGLTREGLRDLARTFEVPGFGRLLKDDLVSAISVRIGEELVAW